MKTPLPAVTQTPGPVLPEIRFRDGCAMSPPIVPLPPFTRTPATVFGSAALPFNAGPIQLPRTANDGALVSSTPAPPLPEIRFLASRVVPPITALGAL